VTTVVLAAVAGLLGVLLVVARLGARSAVVDQRKHALVVLRAIRALVDGGDASTDAVAAALVRLLRLRSCWFEPGPVVAADRPVLEADGTVSARVQRRVPGGLALPAVTTIEVPGGRFVLVASPDVGTSVEERVGASTMAALSQRLVGHAPLSASRRRPLV
jgi:hypothetical protein